MIVKAEKLETEVKNIPLGKSPIEINTREAQTRPPTPESNVKQLLHSQSASITPYITPNTSPRVKSEPPIIPVVSEAEAEKKRQAEAEAEAEKKRQAEAEAEAEAEKQRQAEAEAEKKRQAEAEAEAEKKRQAEAEAEAEKKRQAEAEAEKQIKDNAITKIQALARGKKERKEIEKEKKAKREKKEAAEREKKEAAEREKEAERKKKAATKILKNIKGFVEKKKIDKQDNSALKIQKKYRDHKIYEKYKKERLTDAKNSFARINEKYPETLSELFPELNKDKNLVNYWKEMSKGIKDRSDENILKYYKTDYNDFQKYVLTKVYKVQYQNKDEDDFFYENKFSENFVYLCAVLESVIQIFGSIDVYNTIFKHFKDNCRPSYFNLIFNLDLENLIKNQKGPSDEPLDKTIVQHNAMFSYFKDLLFTCLSITETDRINKVITAKGNKNIDSSCQGIYFASFKFYVFSQKLFKYRTFSLPQFLEYSYSDFLADAEKKIKTKKTYDLFDLLKDLYYDDKSKGKVPYIPPEKIKSKRNKEIYWYAPEALEKIAASFAQNGKTSGGGRLTRKIIKKSIPTKNAQTKKNKGRRDQLRKGGKTHRRIVSSSSSNRTRRKRSRRQWTQKKARQTPPMARGIQ